MVEHQVILFGPPGTSKSHRARSEKAEKLGVGKAHIVPVAFHPDYSHGEFVARLLPKSHDGQIEYHVNPGPFIRALAMAYAFNLEANGSAPVQRVVLLVDEINRGNCAEIFGDVFQLLDRDEDGWSSYEISASDLVMQALEKELGKLIGPVEPSANLTQRLKKCLDRRQLCLPPNLHLIGTMNTSDESIYFMDSAFKRRWHFEFCAESFFPEFPSGQRSALMPVPWALTWEEFVGQLNEFIISDCKAQRLDDKLIGPWFIKATRTVDERRLKEHFPNEFKGFDKVGQQLGTAYGPAQSKAFDKTLLALAEHLSEHNRERLFKQSGYNKDAELKFTRIRSEFGNTNFFYCSRTSFKKFESDEKRLVFEDYLKELADFELASHHIERSDIVGKLLFYLWDNVFDRDKSPLNDKLGLERDTLRTFGQFAEQFDNFIEKLCPKVSKADAAVVEIEGIVADASEQMHADSEAK